MRAEKSEIIAGLPAPVALSFARLFRDGPFVQGVADGLFVPIVIGYMFFGNRLALPNVDLSSLCAFKCESSRPTQKPPRWARPIWLPTSSARLLALAKQIPPQTFDPILPCVGPVLFHGLAVGIERPHGFISAEPPVPVNLSAGDEVVEVAR